MGCRGRETLQNLCDQIPGDALLYSMFKVDAEPIKCPIRGMNDGNTGKSFSFCKNYSAALKIGVAHGKSLQKERRTSGLHHFWAAPVCIPKHDEILKAFRAFLSVGPFTFTYNRGHGECKNPVSNIESCTEDSRMLLSFQACPDVQGTESTGESLYEQLTSTQDDNPTHISHD